MLNQAGYSGIIVETLLISDRYTPANSVAKTGYMVLKVPGRPLEDTGK
ncbi:hypothetical protein [Halalkalibaculum sp. DA384]